MLRQASSTPLAPICNFSSPHQILSLIPALSESSLRTPLGLGGPSAPASSARQSSRARGQTSRAGDKRYNKFTKVAHLRLALQRHNHCCWHFLQCFFFFLGYRGIVHPQSNDEGNEQTWFEPKQRPTKRVPKRLVYGKQCPRGASKTCTTNCRAYYSRILWQCASTCTHVSSIF